VNKSFDNYATFVIVTKRVHFYYRSVVHILCVKSSIESAVSMWLYIEKTARVLPHESCCDSTTNVPVPLGWRSTKLHTMSSVWRCCCAEVTVDCAAAGDVNPMTLNWSAAVVAMRPAAAAAAAVTSAAPHHPWRHWSVISPCQPAASDTRPGRAGPGRVGPGSFIPPDTSVVNARLSSSVRAQSFMATDVYILDHELPWNPTPVQLLSRRGIAALVPAMPKTVRHVMSTQLHVYDSCQVTIYFDLWRSPIRPTQY